MTAVATPDAARLIFAAVAGLILLLVLIIKFKVHAMISILIGAVGIGLMAGMPLSDIIGSVNEGIGNTLKGIALLVGLGSMFGAILEESGGAQTLAVTMVRKFGDEKAAWALGITGLVVAMPVFFGEEPCGHGRKDHPQDMDHHGNAGWQCGLPGSAHHLLLCLTGNGSSFSVHHFSNSSSPKKRSRSGLCFARSGCILFFCFYAVVSAHAGSRLRYTFRQAAAKAGME